MKSAQIGSYSKHFGLSAFGMHNKKGNRIELKSLIRPTKKSFLLNLLSANVSMTVCLRVKGKGYQCFKKKVGQEFFSCSVSTVLNG
jgi:hypothetical protein